MNVEAYLERIGYSGTGLPDFETLKKLQLAHLLYVPFENLSVGARETIVLEEDQLFEKIVLNKRGGLCHELNGLFAALLRDMGFRVAMLSAAVIGQDGVFAPDFDHMALMVSLDESWLVDVGFGESFREPLLINRTDVQPQECGDYQIVPDGDYLILKQRAANKDWQTRYRFRLQPQEPESFEEMCLYHQTSPRSNFSHGRICTKARIDGRVTIKDMRLIETSKNIRRERTMADKEEVAAVLEKEFGIVMDVKDL